MRKYENELLSGGGSTDRARESLTWAVQQSGDEGPPRWFPLPKRLMSRYRTGLSSKKLLDSALAINIDDAPDQRLSNIIRQQTTPGTMAPRPNGPSLS
jgi:hypothetical protein